MSSPTDNIKHIFAEVLSLNKKKLGWMSIVSFAVLCRYVTFVIVVDGLVQMT